MRRALLIWCLLLADLGYHSQPVEAAQRLYPNGVISKQVSGLDLSRQTLRRAPLPKLAYWQSRDSNYNLSIGGSPPSYTGPGDVVSGAVAWWGLRAYNGTYAASLGKLANICTPLDAVCADVNSDTSGNFNLSGTGALLCNNSTSICTVKILYDQSGALSCSSVRLVIGHRRQQQIDRS